jgi:hypothetical protein
MPAIRKVVYGIQTPALASPAAARAASGHAAAPPSNVMNSRRLMSDMGSSSRSGDGPYATHLACRGPGRQVHGADLNWSESGFVQLKAHASAVTV